MKQENAYKIKLLKLLEILRQDSDEDHYIGTTELIDKLADMGIVCDRRTLYKDIEVLNNFGYEVLCEKSPGKPNCYCVADRSFDVLELRIRLKSFITCNLSFALTYFKTFLARCVQQVWGFAVGKVFNNSSRIPVNPSVTNITVRKICL